jgi:hypothetical protein
MQAIAAATFDGNPVDVDVELERGSGLGGGWLGSVGPGILKF